MSTEKKGYTAKVERGERPFQYSAEYQAWLSAARSGRDRALAEADQAWRKRFLGRPHQPVFAD
jgi:hypothetical protein